MTETPSVRHGGALRPVLWLLLVLSAAGNAAASSGALNLALHAAFGVAALLCAAALTIQYVRTRR
jgi:hypothetical protein